jgi:hypothetical protein
MLSFPLGGFRGKKQRKTDMKNFKNYLIIIIWIFPFTTLKAQPDPFPLIDLHIHTKGDLTIDKAIQKSRTDHIQYGIVVNCGKGFPVHTDAQIDSFLLVMNRYSNIFVGMQAEGREWVKMFSKGAIAKFDYVFTDAMTFTDDKGRRNRIWMPAEIVKIMSTEPINIYVNATYLPAPMAGRYDSFWTGERMDAVIAAAVKNNIAIEINNRYKIPSETFLGRAKKAGVKFTIGTNNTDSNFGRADYAREIIGKFGLIESDFYTPVKKNRTLVTIRNDQFFINGQITYPGRTWKGNKIEGLLLNSRMVQGIFDDLNPETAGSWVYPDTRKWDPVRNTNEFVLNMKQWSDYGLLSFTINLQGGSPQGYSNSQPWNNSAFKEDGSLKHDYMLRLEKILNAADRLGMVPIVGLFYFGQDERLRDEAAVKNAVNNAVDWLFEKKYKNILIEINNECNVNKYDHEILKPARVHELIELVKQKTKDGRRFYVGTSYGGKFIPLPNVVKVSDFILIHGNGESNPDNILAMVNKTREVEGYTPKPILFNEDDHFGFEKEWNNFTAAIKGYASWGYFDFRMKDETFENGYQSVPVDWGINSDRKKGFFKLLKEITGY